MNLFDLFESNRKDVDEGYTVMPGINRERYTDLSHEGLEGPFMLKSGKVVYYDPKVGQYYDRDSDYYMTHDEYKAHELDEKSNNLGFKLGSNLVNRRQAHALTTGFKRNKFNFEEYEAESLDDEFAKFKNNKMPAGRAQNPFASDEPAGELSQRPGRAQNPFVSAKPERVREIPRKPQISSAEEQQRTSQLNRCKQLLDIVNSSKRTDVTLSRIGNYIDKIDVNRFNPGELDNIEKYLSNYVAGAVSKKPRKTSKHGKVTMVNPDDVMAEGIGPDMDDPYEQGWYAGFKQVPNPYDRGTPEYDRWEKGYESRLSQPDHYDEDVTEKAEPVKFSAKYPGKPKGKSYYDYYGDNSYHGEPDDIEIDRYSDEPINNFLARTQRSTRAPKFDQDYDTMHEGKTGPGLWANIHAKQNRIKHGSKEHMRKPGSKGAPTAANLKAAKTESVTEGGRLDMSSPEEKAARKAYIKANGHPPPLTPTSVVAKYNPENDKKMRDYYLRRKGVPQDKLDKMKEDGVSETTSDPKFDKMLKGITGKKAVAKQQKADTKQQSRDAFGNMFGGGNPADALSIRKKGVAEGSVQQLSVQQLATISDEALDNAYHYGRSSPGNTFGWQANLKSAAYAKQMIDKGITDIEAISDAIHKGWNVTARAFVQNPEQFSDTEKLRAAGKLEAKLQQREKLMNIGYAQLPDEEQEKDRVVARALLQALKGQSGVAEGSLQEHGDPWEDPNYDPRGGGETRSPEQIAKDNAEHAILSKKLGLKNTNKLPDIKDDMLKMMNHFMGQHSKKKDVDESAADVKYGVFAKGGSVGSQRFRDDPLKTFDTKEEAIADARRRRSGLSKGERGYYRMGYVVKPIKGSAEQVDEIDMGLVGDAVAGAAMGLGSVGLGSYIGHKIGNKIGQKFIDRSNRKEAERRAKEKQDRNQQVEEGIDPIEQLRADILRFSR